MRAVRRFVSDTSGATFESIALSISVMAIAFVATADLLDHMSKKGGVLAELGRESKDLVEMARNLPKPAVSTQAPRASDADYTVTATLPQLRQRSVLDPCTGAQK